MTFPVRFVTVAICLTFVSCAVIRCSQPLLEKEMDLQVLGAIHEIQDGMKHAKPETFTL